MVATMEAPVYRARRFPLHFPVYYRKSGTPDWQDGETINISRTGILFQAGECVPANSLLDIEVRLPAHVILSCQGSIVRTEESMLAVQIHRYSLSRT
jgi:hypothetical protein